MSDRHVLMQERQISADSANRIVLTGGTPLSASKMPGTMIRTLGLRRLLEVEARSLMYLVRWSWRASSPGPCTEPRGCTMNVALCIGAPIIVPPCRNPISS